MNGVMLDDVYFDGHKIFGNHIIYNIWKMVRACEKYSSITSTEVD